ncbi:MAG: SDR family oxidoreductase [Nitrospinota bacterium]|nr:SDR family oxidoreductase [Nitrospinota bacterium]
MNNKFDLGSKIAFVTGAGSGLGRAMAIALAEAGANVGVISRRKSLLHETAQEIEKIGRLSIVCPADVTKSDQVTSAADKIETELGPIDILVNAAGVVNTQYATELSEEDWRYTLDVNLTGTFLVTKAVGERMLLRKRGSIINIGTFLGDRGHRFARSVYNASKAGVVSLSRSLSVEWGGQGVRVNCISPGAHRTPMMGEAAFDEENIEFLKQKTVLGRVGEPEDITGLCVFLASDASSYITGVNVYEDGGGWL